MPVNSTHPEYDATLRGWLRARHVIAGEDAIKAAGTKYVPRLDSQTDDELDAYIARATFVNATARIADGYIGRIFRREPTVKVPDTSAGIGRAMDGFAADADMNGTPLTAYAKNVTHEVIVVGRAGTLVDWDDAVEQRACATLFKAEQIINWQTSRVNGRNVLSLVVLKEDGRNLQPETNPAIVADGHDDPFQPESVGQFRVLKLVPSATSPGDGSVTWSYQVEIWQQQSGKTKRSKGEWVVVESHTPLRRGKTLPLIPFVFHGPKHSLPNVDKLPLADVIAVNLDHYRLNADYKHGLHFSEIGRASCRERV